MAKKQTILQVFVASPDDVQEERAYLEEIIKELNIAWSQSLEIHLELIKYETHSRPSIGKGAQEIINEQIGNDYDIFIGIMWHKFGTPTAKFASGTQEEFENAFKRYCADPNSVSIMFYFKDEAVPPSLIDPEQLIQTNKFKNSLGPRGTLYFLYKKLDEFGRFLRTHLAMEVQNWKKRLDQDRIVSRPISNIDTLSDKKVLFEKATCAETIPVSENDGTEEELGFIDYIELANEQFERLHNILERMGEYTGAVGNTMSEQTELIKKHTENGRSLALNIAKKSANSVADEFNQFVARTNAEIPLLSEAFKKAIDAIAKGTEIYVADFENPSNDQIASTLEQLDSLIGSENGMLEGVFGFRNIVSTLPGMTKDFKKAKISTLETMDKLIEEFNSQINLLSETKKLVGSFFN